MVGSQSQDFAEIYSKWLTSRLSTSVHKGVTELSTPLLDPLNDGMRVYVEQRPSGYLLHDGGLTLETLSLHGIDIEASARRRCLAETVLATCGLAIHETRIQTDATEANLPQRMHFLLSGMHRISDLWLTTRSAGGTDFFERVCGYLDERDVLYTTSMSVPGKTVEHPIDIVIPLPQRRERLVKLIGTPNVNTAKVVSFSWIEIQESRPTSERVVLVNDVSSVEGEEIKKVSDQTVSILEGYSSAVYQWSQRESSAFERFWRAA